MDIDDPRVSQVVFYPRKIKKTKSLPPNVKILEFSIADNIIIGGFFFINSENLPSILLFHGNGEIAYDYVNFYDLFHNCGVNLAVMDFRGYGFSSGNASYSNLIDDALPIYEHFQEWIKDNEFENTIFIQGRSLGSACASEIGANNPYNVKGIIFESGYASIYNMMTRLFQINDPSITKESLRKYSNDTRILKFRKPVLIIHGTNDWIIPNEEAKLIYKALPDDIDKELILIKGAGHNNIFSFENEYFTPLENFIEKNK